MPELKIDDLRKLCADETLVMTRHAINRCHERKITKRDIISAILNGEIIEQYPEAFPYSGCLILGKSVNEKPLHVVASINRNGMIIITAYYPNSEKWCVDLKTRKEHTL